VRFVITDRNAFDSVRCGLELAVALNRLFAGKMTFGVNERLIGSRAVIQNIERGDPAQTIMLSERAEVDAFRTKRSQYLLY
jgi:uncharacterized protein YbbC (DUF1343 family)